LLLLTKPCIKKITCSTFDTFKSVVLLDSVDQFIRELQLFIEKDAFKDTKCEGKNIIGLESDKYP